MPAELIKYAPEIIHQQIANLLSKHAGLVYKQKTKKEARCHQL